MYIASFLRVDIEKVFFGNEAIYQQHISCLFKGMEIVLATST
jgi:hypothetical protein